VDSLIPSERSRVMSLVKSKDTRPEMLVRRLLHSLGYRYRLHVRDLPGCPDLVFVRRRKVVFVNGCFWHRHNCKMGSRMPKSRVTFWRKKLVGNRNRDILRIGQLRDMGWDVLVVWECQTESRKLAKLSKRVIGFLGPSLRT
jgi:DNA mismatch endonuclease (patch repair protein)